MTKPYRVQRKKLFGIVILLGAILALSCTLKNRQNVEIHIRSTAATARSAPSDALSFDCYFASITADDIANTTTESIFLHSDSISCLSLGAVSSVVTPATLSQSGIAMTAPVGSGRNVRLFGVSGTGIVGCGTTKFSSLPFRAPLIEIHELASTSTEIFFGATVELNNAYGDGAHSSNLLASCDEEEPPTVVQGLVLHLDASLANAGSPPPAGCDPATWTDFSTKGHDGTLENFSGCSTALGWLGTGASDDPVRLAFLGGAERVRIPRHAELEPSNSLTMEAWVKAASSPGAFKYILSHLDSSRSGVAAYALYSGSGGGLTAYIKIQGSEVYTPSIDPAEIWNNEWHHIVGTYDGANILIFMDGEQKGASTPVSGNIVYSTDDIYVGEYGSGGYTFTGAIALVSLFNRALTATEILDNCKALVGRFHGAHCIDHAK